MGKSIFTPTQDKQIAELYLSGESAQKIADKFGSYRQPVLHSLIRSGIERRKDWPRARGPASGAWKGGIRMVKGYRHVFIPGHPLARSDGWVAEHRLKLADMITHPKQVVHHKDGNRLNNDPSNLEIFENNAVHRSYHAKHQGRNKDGTFK